MIAAELQAELRALLPEIKMENREGEIHSLGNDGELTVCPQTEQDIVDVLKYANENGKKVSIISGGTKRGYGGILDSVDIILSLENYKGIVEHTVGDMTITVKAGTPFMELQEYLAKYKQKISLDPFLPESATIGGIIAANDSGPKRLGYGSARDAVIGLRMVYPDGTIIRAGGKVVKNVAGYDMNKLFIGSMGTLGVVSEVTLKLRPIPKHESLVLLAFPEGNLDQLKSFATSLLDSMLEPVSLELLDPSLSGKMTGVNSYSLVVSFEDVESSVRYQEVYMKKLIPSGVKMTVLTGEDNRSFWERFYSIAPSGAGLQSNNVCEASLKIGVVNLKVIDVMKEAHLLKDAYNLSIEAHGGLGHGLCHVNLNGSSKDILHGISSLRQMAEQLGGYVIVKHLPLSLRRQIDVWGNKPSHFFLLEGIKTKVDPNRILNPGRFVGGI